MHKAPHLPQNKLGTPVLGMVLAKSLLAGGFVGPFCAARNVMYLLVLRPIQATQ